MFKMIKEIMDLEFAKYKMSVNKLLDGDAEGDVDFLIRRAYEEGLPPEEAAEEIKTGGANLSNDDSSDLYAKNDVDDVDSFDDIDVFDKVK